MQLLCECLVYACCIRQRLPTADVCALVRACAGGGVWGQQQRLGCVGTTAAPARPLASLPAPAHPSSSRRRPLPNAPSPPPHTHLFQPQVSLVHHLSLRVKGLPGDLSHQQQAYTVLHATLLALLPLEGDTAAAAAAAGGGGAAGEGGGGDRGALRALAVARGVGEAVGAAPAGDQYGAVVKLAWGVLQAEHGEVAEGERACVRGM